MGKAGGRVSVLYSFAFARAKKLMVLLYFVKLYWLEIKAADVQ